MIKTINKTIFISLSLLFLVISGCKEDGISPATDNNVSVGYFTPGLNPNNTLTINEAKFLIREIELIRSPGSDAANLKVGPTVITLDPEKVITADVAQIPSGEYSAVRFVIDKPQPGDKLSDPEFFSGSAPGPTGYSVISKGVYNSAPFNYKTPVYFEATIELDNSITVSDASLINITIRVDVNSWFMRDGQYIDPANPNNSSAIDYNIKASFKKAFKDLNRDGVAD